MPAVHVSTAQGARLIGEARTRVDVRGNVPHLLYVKEDLERSGGIKFSSVSSCGRSEALWDMPMVVSDHSPSTLDLKQGDDFFRSGAASPAASRRQLLLGQDRLDLSQIAAVTATNIAERFGSPARRHRPAAPTCGSST
jgi:dihydroorotase-like cyclic amidohydrolase